MSKVWHVGLMLYKSSLQPHQSPIIPPMIILGIDPGYERCGFAVLHKNGADISLKTFGVIRTKAQKNFALRQQEIAEDFQHLLDTHKPNIVSIEDLFFVQNVTTGMKVAQVRGVLIYLATVAGARVVEPKPVEIKSSFCGNGKADKQEIKRMAQMMFGLESQPKLDDAADAIAAGFWATNVRLL